MSPKKMSGGVVHEMPLDLKKAFTFGPNVRKTAEEELKAEWQKWMGEHTKIVTVTEACSKEQGHMGNMAQWAWGRFAS